MLYVVAWPGLAPTQAVALEALRRRHDPDAAALLPAHLTLVFGVPDAFEDELRTLLARIATQAPPLPITFARIACREIGGRRLLYLPVGEGAVELRGWYETLHADGLAPLQRPDLEMEPHLTLAAMASGGAGLRTAQADGQRLALPLAGRVQALGLLRRRGDRLQPLARFALSGQRSTPAANQ